MRIAAGERLVGGADAVLENGDVFAELEHLVQAMRDVEDGESLGAQAAQQVEQRAHFVRGERGGRFVQDQHLGAAEQRLGDLHHLALAERQRLDRQIERHGEPEPLAYGGHFVGKAADSP